MKIHKPKWWEVYSNLNLRGGELTTISDDDEDMLTIDYPSGLMIDVGYIADDKKYIITVVKDHSVQSWNSPIKVIETQEKALIANILQETINIIT